MDLFDDKYITKDEASPPDGDKEEGWMRELPLRVGAAVARSSLKLNLVRRVYHRQSLERDANYQRPSLLTLTAGAKKVARDCGVRECITNSLPIARWLPKYKFNKFLLGDCIAGATTAVMHIPQGMAYALLSGAPPIIGLYMAFFPILTYVIFGTSAHVSMGTFAVACLMVGKVVAQHATTELGGHIQNITGDGTSVLPHVMGPEYTPIQIISVVCLLVGIIQIAMWMLRLGALSALLSDPLVSGFTTGASFHVLASQLKDLFGVPKPKTKGNFKVIMTVIEVSKSLPNLNWTAFVTSFIACVIIALNNELLKPWVSKKSRIPVPIELIAIIIGTLVSRYWNMPERFSIAVVGEVPTGLPMPQIPPLELMHVVALDAFVITMVTYTITMSMALIFANKEKYKVDANQELLALGASNLFGSFFSCAPICASLSRSYIQYQAGCKTPITSVVSATLILCVLLWIGPFFEQLPRCVLASIIVVSLKGLFMQVKDLKKFWKLSKLDAMVWLIAFLVTTLINIDVGLWAGLAASMGALFIRAQKPYTALLGRMQDTDLYLDVKRYRGAHEIPGIKIFYYCGGLNFATKDLFRTKLYRKIGCLAEGDFGVDEDNNSMPSDSSNWQSDGSKRINCVIIDLTALSYVDAPGVKTLASVHSELAQNNMHVLMAGANGPVLEMIDRCNSLEPDKLQIDTFPTVHDAVCYYQAHETKFTKKMTLSSSGLSLSPDKTNNNPSSV